MIHTWFEVKIRYEKIADNGMQKKVTEPYLFDALSFTESEGKCIQEMTVYKRRVYGIRHKACELFGNILL